ncbi:MAG: hypothetical protein GXY44_12465 [Phycisphaerales bacterium]|nr:hypothetical protein [Phycisphaerales bacterium]
MTMPRIVGVLSALASIGIAVVVLRADQARHARQIQKLHIEQQQMHQRIWEQEMEMARLRSPRMIRERAERLGLADGKNLPNLAPPPSVDD